MPTKILIYNKSNASGNTFVRFACTPEAKLLEIDALQQGLEAFAAQNTLNRHPEFDWHYGNNGRDRALLESAILLEKVCVQGRELSLKWMSFREMRTQLQEGDARNFVQLAVQFISNGGIQEDVIAADYDEAFIKELLKRT